MQELHIDDVQQLFIELTHVYNVAGQKTGLLPAGVRRAAEYSLGHAHSGLQLKVWFQIKRVPFSNNPLLLVSQRVLPEGQNDELRAVHQHYRTPVLWIHTHYRDVYVLHKTIL